MSLVDAQRAKEPQVTPKVSVIILGYNDREHLRGVLESVLTQSYKHYETIFIDNASTDDSYDFVRKQYPSVRCMRNENNLGYAGAYAAALNKIFDPLEENVAAAVLLNPDMVVDRDWLRELVAAAYTDPKIALVQSKVLLWKNGKTDLLNTSGNAVNYLGFGFCSDYREVDHADDPAIKDVAYPSGSSLLIKREAYHESGGLDPHYFAYVEDQDLAWRARMYGYRCVCATRSKAWHKYRFDKTERNKFKFYLLERNRSFFLLKHFQLKTLILITPMLVVMEAGIVVDAIRRGYLWDKLRGYGSVLVALPRLFRQRKAIQRRRVVNDRSLFGLLSPTVRYPEIDSIGLRVANRMLLGYHALIKTLV